MPVNEFLPFATGGGANVLSQVDYDALGARGTGYMAGIARSPELNKTWRQASVMSSALGQFIMDSTGADVLDNGIVPDLAALFLRAIQARGRIKLTANLDIYVSPTGNDVSNTGLSVGSPFQTIQRAWNLMFQNYDLNGFSVVINCANGTYNQQTTCIGTPVGVGPSSSITFRGNTTTPSVCIISVTLAMCFSIGMVACPVYVEGFRMLATGTSASYIQRGTALNLSSVVCAINRVEFGACDTNHITVSNGALGATNANPYSIVGSAPMHIFCYAGGLFVGANSTITLTGTPAFSGGFAVAVMCSVIELYTNTFVGSATGPRYQVNTNGVINTQGGGANYFPGNAVGVVASGGQYV